MEPTYEKMTQFMENYFETCNNYAQNPETVHRMDDYYTQDVHFFPYISAFGGPENVITTRDDFYRTFTTIHLAMSNLKTMTLL